MVKDVSKGLDPELINLAEQFEEIVKDKLEHYIIMRDYEGMCELIDVVKTYIKNRNKKGE